MKIDLHTFTSGSGHWSTRVTTVMVNAVELDILDNDEESESRFGELRAYFAEDQWNCNVDGLIYTDQVWLDTFRSALSVVLGFSIDSVKNDVLMFSEHGMQGENYVSMDVNEAFIKEWLRVSEDHLK
jgi:5-methylcytosine-specific restriction endonuclease McrBC GTP-binding regulatory subunit McrB